jgi:hypothetical protein
LVGNNGFRAHGTDRYPDLNNTAHVHRGGRRQGGAHRLDQRHGHDHHDAGEHEEDVRQFYHSGDIQSAAVTLSLLTQLDLAETAWNLGNCLAANSVYGAFSTQVPVWRGITITPTSAKILVDDAKYLIDHCGKP